MTLQALSSACAVGQSLGASLGVSTLQVHPTRICLIELAVDADLGLNAATGLSECGYSDA
jgi:hypothetical protein